jgi:hypothetical protein
MAHTWQVLLSRRLVSDPIGSDAYRVFERDMSDMSDAQIIKGLEKSKDFTDFFTTPAFRELCRVTPVDYGIPDAKHALFEACQALSGHEWSHPAVYHAAVSIGTFDLKSKTERELWPQWEYAYSVVCQRIMSGEQLNIEVPKALPQEIHIPANEAKVREYLGKLKSMF